MCRDGGRQREIFRYMKEQEAAQKMNLRMNGENQEAGQSERKRGCGEEKEPEARASLCGGWCLFGGLVDSTSPSLLSSSPLEFSSSSLVPPPPPPWLLIRPMVIKINK